MSPRYQKWSPAEDQHLRDHWQRADLTIAQIAAVIDRSADGAKTRGHVHLKLGDRPSTNEWTDDVFQEVLRLYALGMGPSEIAAKYGWIRNKVIGKLARAGAVRPKKEDAKTPPKPAPKPAAPVIKLINNDRSYVRAEALPPRVEFNARAFVPIPGQDPVGLMDLAPSHCKWPVGLDTDGVHTFCGRQRAGDKPYCSDHARVATQAPKPGAPKNANEMMRALRRWAA